MTDPLAPPAVLREATASDAGALYALLDDATTDARAHAESARRQLDTALASRADGTESRALVVEEDGALHALALYGLVAGALGAGKLHLVAVHRSRRRRGYGRALVRATAERLAALGARFVIVEMPDECALASAAALLANEAVEEIARVGDFYRDGVDLVIRRRWLSAR